MFFQKYKIWSWKSPILEEFWGNLEICSRLSAWELQLLAPPPFWLSMPPSFVCRLSVLLQLQRPRTIGHASKEMECFRHSVTFVYGSPTQNFMGTVLGKIWSQTMWNLKSIFLNCDFDLKSFWIIWFWFQINYLAILMISFRHEE